MVGNQKMDRWQEYLPVSSACLLSTFDRAVQSRAQFSPAERALFMACEFWIAVMSRRLVAQHSVSDAIDTLRYMSILYSALGAPGVANEIIAAIDELGGASHSAAHRHCLGKLQENLLKVREPVDLLIARLAEKLGLGCADGLNWEYGSQDIPLFA
jgi:hypothetical protein